MLHFNTKLQVLWEHRSNLHVCAFEVNHSINENFGHSLKAENVDMHVGINSRPRVTHAVSDKIPIAVVISLQELLEVFKNGWQRLFNVGLFQLSLK